MSEAQEQKLITEGTFSYSDCPEIIKLIGERNEIESKHNVIDKEGDYLREKLSYEVTKFVGWERSMKGIDFIKKQVVFSDGTITDIKGGLALECEILTKAQDDYEESGKNFKAMQGKIWNFIRKEFSLDPDVNWQINTKYNVIEVKDENELSKLFNSKDHGINSDNFKDWLKNKFS